MSTIAEQDPVATRTRQTPRRGRRLTDAERSQKRDAERERVRQAVERLRSSDGWQAWLTARSRFHRYSLANQMLIASQHPTATRVAGFRAWLDLGYAVCKGERALYIWAPCPPSKRQVEQARERGEDVPRTFFRMTAVFAQDQVAPLPEPARPAPLEPPCEPLEGDSLAGTWEPLVALGASIGSTVTIGDTGQAGGYYAPADKRIVISDRGSVNAQVRTLVHELAHALIRADRHDDDPELTYAQEELVVESVAYSVTGTIGLDVSGESISYLAGWSTGTDLAIVETAAKLVNRLACRIEDAAATVSA